jgi:hypothetical protein
MRQHPEEARTFDQAMVSVASIVAPALVAAYDFSRRGTVVDVGGGNGSILAAILKSSPKLRGVLIDVPHVAGGHGHGWKLRDSRNAATLRPATFSSPFRGVTPTFSNGSSAIGTTSRPSASSRTAGAR